MELGHFQLLEEIGSGGMGAIFKAFDPTLNRHVAIKVLKPDLAGNPQFVEDFLREARNAAAISHPHIVQVHFVGEAAGQYYVVMELLDGRPLRSIIEDDGPLTEEAGLQMASDVAEALRAAYVSHQMIHGDIKPGNIFLTESSGAKVLDYGLAKLANLEVTEAGEVWGSPYYVSPERIGGQTEDFRSDVYSLGATLFHTLTGQPPFDADTAAELAVKRLNERAPSIRTSKAELTEQTEKVVAKMLSKSPLTRYRDYDHLLEQLREAKTAATAKRLGIEVHEGPPPAAPEPEPVPEPAPRKFPWLIVGIIGGTALVAGVGIAFWLNRPAPPPPLPVPRPKPVQQQPTIVTQVVTAPVAPVAPAHTLAPKPASPPPPTAEQLKQQEQAKLEALRLQQQAVLDETKLVQTTDAELAALYPKYDFLAVIARYQTLAGQLITPDAKKLVTQRLVTAKTLVDFKTQLATDIALQPYTKGDLQTGTKTTLAGTIAQANDTELTAKTQYGDLTVPWSDLPPATLLQLARFYATAAADAVDTKSRRSKLISTFATQYHLPVTPPKQPAPATPPKPAKPPASLPKPTPPQGFKTY